MSTSPGKDIIQDIAIELGVDPSFVEKDWYAVKAIARIATIEAPGIKPIFSGGTSLSKGYGLIRRFSEDLDFKIISETDPTRDQCRIYRDQVITAIDEVDDFTVDKNNLIKGDKSRFFGFNVAYPQNFLPGSALRPMLKLEMRFQKVALETEQHNIASFVTQFTKQPAETAIDCVSPVETAADKISALLWRIDAKDRTKPVGNPQNDPTTMRHLHDLCALQSLDLGDPRLVETVKKAFNLDQGRGGSSRDASVSDMARQVLHKLESDPEYEKEYRDFVDAMSYAPDAEKIDFRTALDAFREYVELITYK